MNKSQFIDAISSKGTGLSKGAISKTLDVMLQTICESLAKGDEVTFLKFGTFKQAQRSAKTSRNPQTGALMQIPAKKVPVFKAGKQLKDAVLTGKIASEELVEA
ncbi:MAG: HU family DNA-binding protein [Gammaproteobacteria bacterium]